MTHSLHRSGDIESQKRDFNWFMYPTKNMNDQNVKEKTREFIGVVEEVGSENWGDVKTGTISQVPSEYIKERLTDKSRIRGVFTSKEKIVEFLKKIKAKDIGQSVVVTGVLSEVLPACREAGIKVHSINYSLGVWGKKEKLPDEHTLSITTMCGHHMMPPKYVQYVQDRVDKGEITAEEGAKELAGFCYCGIFNPLRCKEILSEKR